MTTFRQFLENFHRRPGMFIPWVKYQSIVAFVTGFDAACDGGPLTGFEEWLIPRAGQGNNLAWPGLVLHIAFPDASDPSHVVSSTPETEKHAIDVLFRTIFEFDDYRSKANGLRRIYLEYEHWLRGQDWYDKDSPQWVDPG
jgi:hypothetical protein